MIKEDCIYYVDRYKDTNMHECKYRRSLFSANDAGMCRQCRLWDSYIPNTSNKEQIEYAQKWQNMSYDEQPDYREYFND